MARRDRQCMCCQAKYQYCPTCGQDRMKPTWMVQFCSETCKELWRTATRFNMNLIEKSEAKAIVEALELKEKSAYVECVQKDIDKILAVEIIEEMPTVIEEPVIVEEPAVVEAAPILVEEPVFIPKKKQKSHEVVKKNRR